MATADTQERILDAAELLFARQGFAGTSLRNVIAEAGVNLAAVHYHFGNKPGLVRAVFARRFAPINRERLRLLDDLQQQDGGGDVDVERILGCLIGPILRAAREQSEGLSIVGELVGRVHTEADVAMRQIFYKQFEEVGDRFVEALSTALPGLPREELYYRFHFAIAAMAASLVNPEEVRFLSKGRIDPAADPERFVRRWTTFVAAGLHAAATPDNDHATPKAVRSRARSAPTGRASRRPSGKGESR